LILQTYFGKIEQTLRPGKYISIEIKMKRRLLKLESSPQKEKITFIKKACEGLLINSFKFRKLTGIRFSISTNVFGED